MHHITEVFKRLGLRKPDFLLVLMIVVALAILFLLTFELWLPHGGAH
jgi:hypothetical protein